MLNFFDVELFCHPKPSLRRLWVTKKFNIYQHLNNRCWTFLSPEAVLKTALGDKKVRHLLLKICRTFLTPKAVFKTALGDKKVQHILLTIHVYTIYTYGVDEHHICICIYIYICIYDARLYHMYISCIHISSTIDVELFCHPKPS